MKRLIISAIAALSFTGCVNVMYHIPPAHSTDIYSPTCFVAKNCVGNWCNSEYKSKYPIESAWIQMTWLIWVVDLPCEAVADTFWFPYDLYRKNTYEEAQKNKKVKTGRFGASAVGEENCKYKMNVKNYSIDVD